MKKEEGIVKKKEILQKKKASLKEKVQIIEKDLVELEAREIRILEEDIAKLRSRAIKFFAGYDYYKLTGLIICIILAYFLFNNPSIKDFISGLGSYGYLGIFIAGIFLALGFTSPFAAGFFIVLNPTNLWLAAIIGGLGAVAGDLMIFHSIRFSFMDEFERLENEKIMRAAKNLLDKTIGKRIELYLMYALAGIFIASPLPDEAGVTMLAGLTRIDTRHLATISFVLHAIGIFVLCAI